MHDQGRALYLNIAILAAVLGVSLRDGVLSGKVYSVCFDNQVIGSYEMSSCKLISYKVNCILA